MRRIIIIVISVFFIGTLFCVSTSSALEVEPSAVTGGVYSVFFFIPGSPPLSNVVTFTPGGAITIATSLGNGTYVDLGGPFVGYFFGFDVHGSSAMIMMAGIAIDPFLVGTGVVSLKGGINFLTFIGRSLL